MELMTDVSANGNSEAFFAEGTLRLTIPAMTGTGTFTLQQSYDSGSTFVAYTDHGSGAATSVELTAAGGIGFIVSGGGLFRVAVTGASGLSVDSVLIEGNARLD